MDYRSFSDYPNAFLKLANAQTIPCKELSSALLSCSIAASAASFGNSERAQGVAREVFSSVCSVYNKFESRLSLEQKRELISCISKVVILFPCLTNDFLSGGGASAARIFLCAIPIINDRFTVDEVQQILQSAFSALAKMDLSNKEVSIVDAIGLFIQSSNLFIRTLDLFDAAHQASMLSVFEGASGKVGALGGVGVRIFNGWRDELDRVDKRKQNLHMFVGRAVQAIAVGVASLSNALPSVSLQMDEAAKSLAGALDRTLAAFFDGDHPLEERESIKILREIIFSELSTIYPLALIERSNSSWPLSSLLLPKESIQKACCGLKKVDIANIPQKQAFAYYTSIIAAMIQVSGCFSRQEYKEFFASLSICSKKWRSNSDLYRKTIFAGLSVLEGPQKGWAPVSSNEFQNFVVMLTDVVHRVIEDGEALRQEDSEAILRGFKRLADMNPDGSDVRTRDRERLEKSRKGFLECSVEGLCFLRPAIALDWFDTAPQNSPGIDQVLEWSASALYKMVPEKVGDPYAADQFARVIGFMLSHISEMKDGSYCSTGEKVSAAILPWRAHSEVVSQTFAAVDVALRAILEKKSNDASCCQRAVDLLINVLTVLEGDETFPPYEIPPSIAAVVDSVCEISVLIAKHAHSRAKLSEFLDEVIQRIAQAAPGAVIDWFSRKEPGTIPADIVRKLEMLLISTGRYTLLTELQTRLALLEIVGVKYEQFCLVEGLPSGTPRFGDPLSLCMQESMVLDDLDVACMVHCKDFASDSLKRSWVLFALRRYIRSFLQKERKAYLSIYRWVRSIYRYGDTEQAIAEGFLGPASLTPREEAKPVAAVRAYDSFCEGSPVPSAGASVINEANAHFQRLFSDAVLRARKVQKRYGRLWPIFDRGIEAATLHIKKMVGYGMIAELKKGPIHIPLLSSCDTIVETISEALFDSWILRMMAGGEEELARAVAELIAPSDPFANKFLCEMRLLNEEGVSAQTPPSPPRSFVEEPPKPAIKIPPKPKPKKKRYHEPLSQSPPEETSAPVGQTQPSPEDLAPSSESFYRSDAPRPLDSAVDSLAKRLQTLSLDREAPPSPLWAKSVTVSKIEECLNRPLGEIDRRVHSWKSGFFVTQSQDQYDRHTYPYQIIHLIREFGEREPWASSTGRMNEHYVCIGTMERYGRKLPDLFGVFSEAFSPEEDVLYHHDILDRPPEALMEKFRLYGTFFDRDSQRTPKATTDFQKVLFEKVKAKGSFFSQLDGVPSKKCYGGRFSVQISDMTVRISDVRFRNAYTLALRVFPCQE